MRLKSILFACVGILLMCLAGCTSSPDLYKWASSEHVFVASGTPETFLGSAGCTVTDNDIILGPTLQKIVEKEKNGEAVFDIKGADLSSSLFAVDKNKAAVFAFNIVNMGDFVEWLKDVDDELEFFEQDGYTCAKLDNYATLFMKDNEGVIFCATKGTKADLAALEAFRDNARTAPLSAWQITALQDGNAANFIAKAEALFKYARLNMHSIPMVNAYDPEELKDAWFVGSFSLNGLKAQFDYCLAGAEGKPLQAKVTLPEINTSLLKYATATDVAVFMTGIPADVDWADLISDAINAASPYGMNAYTRQMVAAVADVLDDMEGTVMLAAGPLDGGDFKQLSGWSGVIAAQFKEGEAEKYFEHIGSFMPIIEQQFNMIDPDIKQHVVTADKEIKVTIPGQGDVYITHDGDMLFISLRPLSAAGGCAITASDFANYKSALVVKLPKDNAFTSVLPIKFPFGENMVYGSDGSLNTLSIQLTETDGVFLDNIIKFVNDLSGLRY